MGKQWNKKLFLSAVKTPITEKEAILCLKRAWKNYYGWEPRKESLAILWSQTVLETGRYKYSYCYNVGNEKSRYNDKQHWTMYKCSEILNSKEIFFEPPHDQCKFKAFNSSQEGFDHYFEFLATRKRYAKAWKQVMEGNLIQFVSELKHAGYFTASLNLYMKGMTRLNAEFHRRADELLNDGKQIESGEHPIDFLTNEEKSQIDFQVWESNRETLDRYFASTNKDPDDDDLPLPLDSDVVKSSDSFKEIGIIGAVFATVIAAISYFSNLF